MAHYKKIKHMKLIMCDEQLNSLKEELEILINDTKKYAKNSRDITAKDLSFWKSDLC